MNPVARVRHVLARRPWLYWSAVVLIAAAVAATVAGAAAGVDEARRSWGSPRTVVVATSDIAPGEPLTGVVEVVERPRPMVPVSAIDRVEPDAVARQQVAAGEMVVAADVAGGAAPVSLIPPGWQALAVAETVPTGAVVGDRVAAASGGVVLAADALVVGSTADSVVVAIPEGQAAQVAHAAASGELVLLLRP